MASHWPQDIYRWQIKINSLPAWIPSRNLGWSLAMGPRSRAKELKLHLATFTRVPFPRPGAKDPFLISIPQPNEG